MRRTPGQHRRRCCKCRSSCCTRRSSRMGVRLRDNSSMVSYRRRQEKRLRSMKPPPARKLIGTLDCLFLPLQFLLCFCCRGHCLTLKIKQGKMGCGRHRRSQASSRCLIQQPFIHQPRIQQPQLDIFWARAFEAAGCECFIVVSHSSMCGTTP